LVKYAKESDAAKQGKLFIDLKQCYGKWGILQVIKCTIDLLSKDKTKKTSEVLSLSL
jgi:hypothetical protein